MLFVHCHIRIPLEAPSVKQNPNTPLSAIIISSVILYVLSSTLFCFIGSICGWVGHKHKAMASKNSNNSQPIPLYEDVQPSFPRSFPGLSEDQEREFKLEENVAYGPARSIK